jgi:hypothetical protein
MQTPRKLTLERGSLPSICSACLGGQSSVSKLAIFGAKQLRIQPCFVAANGSWVADDGRHTERLKK